MFALRFVAVLSFFAASVSAADWSCTGRLKMTDPSILFDIIVPVTVDFPALDGTIKDPVNIKVSANDLPTPLEFKATPRTGGRRVDFDASVEIEGESHKIKGTLGSIVATDGKSHVVLEATLADKPAFMIADDCKGMK